RLSRQSGGRSDGEGEVFDPTKAEFDVEATEVDPNPAGASVGTPETTPALVPGGGPTPQGGERADETPVTTPWAPERPQPGTEARAKSAFDSDVMPPVRVPPGTPSRAGRPMPRATPPPRSLARSTLLGLPPPEPGSSGPIAADVESGVFPASTSEV